MIEIDCRTCGGSGGGPEHWYCPACKGRGTISDSYSDGDYIRCGSCEEIHHEDGLVYAEDAKMQMICETCIREHRLHCRACDGYFLYPLRPNGVCSTACQDALQENDNA